MQISEKKLNELYKAIYDPLMDFRVKHYSKLNLLPDLDKELFNLETEIFNKVKTALNIKE